MHRGENTAMLCKLRRTGGHEAVVRLLLKSGAEARPLNEAES